MTTADKPLFEETDDPALVNASLDDVVRQIATEADMIGEQAPRNLDGEYSLIEVEPKDNGHTLITLQDNDGNILVEDGLQNIKWDALDDNTFETYKQFLQQAAEDPSTGGDAQDTILPIRSKETSSSSSSTKKTTHFTRIAQQYITENHDELLAELLENASASVHVADDLAEDYNVGPFNNEQRLNQLRAHIRNHAPDLSPERSAELKEAAQSYRDELIEALENTQLNSTRSYYSEQFDNDDKSDRKKGIGSLAHDIIHWQLQNADDISAKALTSAVKDQAYRADYQDEDDMEETALFLAGSDDWLLYGAAHDFFDGNQALLDQYEATRDVVDSDHPTAQNMITNGAAMVEFPSRNHGSRQILRQLTRRNWIHDEYGSGTRNTTEIYAFDTPKQSTGRWHFDKSVLNHVLEREGRYMNAIGSDIIERETARLGDSYTNDELVEASLRAITQGVPEKSQREQVFTSIISENQTLEDPTTTKREPQDVYLVKNVGAQLMANATIRAHADGHSIDEPLRTYNN